MHRKPFKVRALDLPSCGGGWGVGGWRQSPTLAGREAVPNSGGPVVTFDGLDRYEYPMSYWEPDCMHPAPTKNKPTNKKRRKKKKGEKEKKGEAGREPGTLFFPLHSLVGRGVGYRGRRNGWLLLLRARPEPSEVVLIHTAHIVRGFLGGTCDNFGRLYLSEM